ncbi:MAG: pyridoxamine 5'-phosphate oxidase family protein [Planctomycetota bacterium]|jgi:uncharacterized pyridoxamine 5'-phosphate oxidase family protein|nr:pyridoxamine 5'-phosphate oxidase family protein [Planctomycetota bacterium]
MRRILDFLSANPVFYFATVAGDAPAVRPFGFAMENAGKLYFCTGGAKNVCKQLRDNPRFEICACGADGKWLRLAASAEFDTTPELKEKAFALMPMLRDIYGGDNAPEFVLFFARNGVAVFNDPQGAGETIKL